MYRLILIVAVVLTLALAGCSKNLVSVEGVSVPESDISRIVAAQEELMGPSAKNQEASIQANVTQNLVNQALLIQEATKEGITVTDQEITQKYEEIKQDWDSNPETQKSLEAQGYTEDNMKDKVREQLLIDKLTQTLGKDQKRQIAEIQELLQKIKSQSK